jgi:protein gp37
MPSKIEWTGETWNPIRARRRSTGKQGWYCQKVSPGCAHCYAESMNRFRGNGIPYTVPGLDTLDLYLDEKTLLQPLRWKKPRSIFVCSMTDLFADFVPDEWLDRIYAVMALTPSHTYQVLTKRPERRRKYFAVIEEEKNTKRWIDAAYRIVEADPSPCAAGLMEDQGWPLPNVWEGATVCNQEEANANTLTLLQTPAAVRWLSCEPLLGPMDLTELHCSEDDGDGQIEYQLNALNGVAEVLHSDSMDIISDGPENPRIDWVVVGGESGHSARPFHTKWAEDIVEQCRRHGVPCFVKQLGAYVIQDGERHIKRNRKGADMSEWPHKIRVRQFPVVRG